MKLINNFICFLCIALLATGCSKKEYGEESDVHLPIPELADLPAEVNVGENLTIKGKNFTKPSTVTMGDLKLTVVSQSETEILVKMPRVFTKNYITVRNVFNRTGNSKAQVGPKYPDPSTITVVWPTQITKGAKLTLTGTNIDMVTEITLLRQKYTIDAALQTPTSISFQVPKNIEETHGVLLLKTILNTTFESPSLPIVD